MVFLVEVPWRKLNVSRSIEFPDVYYVTATETLLWMLEPSDDLLNEVIDSCDLQDRPKPCSKPKGQFTNNVDRIYTYLLPLVDMFIIPQGVFFQFCTLKKAFSKKIILFFNCVFTCVV